MQPIISESDRGGKENGIKFRSVVAQLAENTAMHGLPNMHKAKSKEKKTFWVAVLLFGVCEYCHVTLTIQTFIHLDALCQDTGN